MNNPNLAQRTQLFLIQSGINHNQTLLQEHIIRFFNQLPNNTYILFKNAALYFINNNQTAHTVSVNSTFSDNYYLRFDGKRITRIDPNYYLGAGSDYLAPNLTSDANILGSNSDFSSNNNNNNNNNNGNNNG